MPDWVVWTLAVVLFVAVFATAIKIEDPLERWFLEHGRNRPWPTAGLVLVTHLAACVLWFVVAVSGTAIKDATGDAAWAGVVVVPMILAHGPLVICFMPLQYSGYAFPRRDFRQRGASNAVSRAMYWTAAPFAIAGLITCIAAFDLCFSGRSA